MIQMTNGASDYLTARRTCPGSIWNVSAAVNSDSSYKMTFRSGVIDVKQVI
jgi:hypothetical protein